MKRQLSLFENMRLTLDQAVSNSIESMREYGQWYDHWAIAYSGGKDSTATLTFVLWAIESGKVPMPKSLTVLYADTRMELPPLYAGAMQLLEIARDEGHTTQIVRAGIDDRFLVYMLGYGVPPASNTFRWCTPKIKVEPMLAALHDLRVARDEKFLMLTGVRQGESAARDQRIAVSCSVNGGECGQGWFQVGTPESVADTLAPILHWRLCHVFDWLYFDPLGHGYPSDGVAAVYGEDDVRTGCIGCPLASRDNALERVIKQPEYEYLSPLLELKPLWRELKKPQWRKRKAAPEKRMDGKWSKNVQRMGPLTMKGRAYGFDRVLDIQERAGVCFINEEEGARIREMWALDMWPRKWCANDINADVMIDALSMTDNGSLVKQALLLTD